MMKKSHHKIFLFLFFIFLSFPLSVNAATITLQNATTETLGKNDEYSVNASLAISAKDGTKYYLRAVFFKPDTTNYCGFTWNGADWFSGPYSTNEGWKQFYPVTIVNNTWSGIIKAKIDSENSGCKDSGTYLFKMQRFTESGSGNFDTQDGLTVQITLPTATPTDQPTPTKTPSPTNVPSPTKSSSATKVPTSATNTDATDTGSSWKKIESTDDTLAYPSIGTDAAYPSAILGVSTTSAEKRKASPSAKKKVSILVKDAAKQNFSGLFMGIGGLLLMGCGILIFLRIKKQEA